MPERRCGRSFPGNGSVTCARPRRHAGQHESGEVNWQDTLDRWQIARRLDALAARPVPPIAASHAAHWTRTARLDCFTPPDALIDVWVALDDWVQHGSPEGPARFAPPQHPWCRLVHCLTRFDSYLRGFLR